MRKYQLLAVLFVLATPVLALAQAASQPTAPPLNQALAFVGTLLSSGLAWLIFKASQSLHAHQKSALGQYATNCFDRLGAAAQTCVQALIAKGQLDLSSGLTKANLKQFETDAVTYLKSYLGPAGLAELATVVGADQVATVLSANLHAAAANATPAPAAAPAS